MHSMINLISIFQNPISILTTPKQEIYQQALCFISKNQALGIKQNYVYSWFMAFRDSSWPAQSKDSITVNVVPITAVLPRLLKISRHPHYRADLC